MEIDLCKVEDLLIVGLRIILCLKKYLWKTPMAYSGSVVILEPRPELWLSYAVTPHPALTADIAN